MDNLIPLEHYTAFYYYVLMVIVLVTFLHSKILGIDELKNHKFIRTAGLLLFVFVVLYMGLRPISGTYFGDMGTYNQYFEGYQHGVTEISNSDVGFDLFMRGCSAIMTAQMFFFLCAIIYVMPIFYLSKKWFPVYWFYAFLILVSSFSFWSYGVNGIRNGIATSLFLMAITFAERKMIMIIFLFLACSVHKSILLPTIAYTLTLVNNNPKKYFYAWLVAIPLSLVLGGFFETFFQGLGFADRTVGYLTNLDEEIELGKAGFRWDFILYSALGVYAGYYFVIIKGFKDELYNHLLNTYLLTNAIWILVIRANFSNRFAYLSWFMIGLIIIYPLLKQRLFENTNRAIGNVLLFYFLFTFFMNVILAEH